MAKRFFVWADANCNGENIEWIELTGVEYFEFVHNPLNKDRRIIHLTDSDDYEDDEIFIEATEERYEEWRKEYKHSRYIKCTQEGIEIVSFDYMSTFESFDYASSINVEDEVINAAFIDVIKDAISHLSKEEKRYVQILTEICESTKTVDEILKSHCIPRRTYYRKIEKIKKKLAQI